MYYGYQIIPSAINSSIDILNLYEFDTKPEFDIWIQSDLTDYTFNRDLFNHQKSSKYGRRFCPKEDADILIDYGKLPIRLKAQLSPSYAFSDDLTGHFLNIRPISNSVDHPFASSFLKDFPLSGMVLRFASKKEKSRFIDSHKEHFGDNMISLKKSSPIVKSAKMNGLIVNVDSEDPILPSQISYVIANYDQIDPAKNFLAMICFKDWSSPQIFSFHKKSSRDLFINKIKGIRFSPFFVFSISNFNPIATLAVMKGTILNGSVSSCLDFVSTYLISKIDFLPDMDASSGTIPISDCVTSR